MGDAVSMAQRCWAIVTGAGSGIGSALTGRLLAAGVSVVAVGRRQAALDRTVADAMAKSLCSTQSSRKDDTLIRTVSVDIATTHGRTAICDAVPADDELRYLVHNAAVGDPCMAGVIDVDEFRYAMEVNVIAPLALTQALLPRLSRSTDGRVLHLGTGVAHMIQPGTGTYGITKLAFHRLYQQLSVDLAAEGVPPCTLTSDQAGLHHMQVVVASARPGVVDTEGMRDHVRKANDLQLPHAEYFNRLFGGMDKGMQPVGLVSEFLWRLLSQCPREDFGKLEYSINQA